MFKVQSEYKNANVARTIRFTEAIFNELNIAAGKNDVSFNSLVLQCCKYALSQVEEEENTKSDETVT